ncbi:MAG: hypothetical protein H6735_33575 [Alphaproteobacteria bacterium]|nr:hypothetical protein [Alphaproteobacteria bacterium]
MTPEELLALILSQARGQGRADPGPKRPTSGVPTGRVDLSPEDAAFLADVMSSPQPNASAVVQPSNTPVDPEFLRAYAAGNAYVEPGGSVQMVQRQPAAPPAPSGPNARATLPSTPPPRPAPAPAPVVYPAPADMTFVRPANPPAPSDRGQVTTDYEPRSRARRAVDSLFGRR